MEPKSPEIVGQNRAELVSEMISRKAVTISIKDEELNSYQKAASATGFNVEKIAMVGEKFPHFGKERSLEKVYKESNVSDVIVGNGYIAVAIKKPEGSKEDHTPFWQELKSIKAGDAVTEDLKKNPNFPDTPKLEGLENITNVLIDETSIPHKRKNIDGDRKSLGRRFSDKLRSLGKKSKPNETV